MHGVRAFLIGCLLVALLISIVCVPLSVAQGDPPLDFENNFFVTGDYVVAGAQNMNSNYVTIGGTSYAVGTITVPDANPGIHGKTSVPIGAQIVDALLYWQTVELTGSVPGQPGTGQNGFFRPVVHAGPAAPGYAISGVALPSNGQTTWSSGGCTSTSTAKLTRTYRAHVLDYLPEDANGNIIANGTYEVRLPSTGPNTPLTLGATLVLIYRVLSQNVALNSIVIYDGAYGQTENALIMMQTMQGFYDAAAHPVSKLTHIVGSGKNNKYQTVYLDDVALPSHSGHGLPPFPGHYGGSWDNTTWTFGDPNYPEIANPVQAGDASATTEVIPAANQGGCVSWGAVIISTTVQNSDNDGLLDVWKAPPITAKNPTARPGYCDASVNEGVCNAPNPPMTAGDPSWVDLPGAVKGEQDVFVQLDYMCSSLMVGMNACSSNLPYCNTSDAIGNCLPQPNYSFNPYLTTDSSDNKTAVQKVIDGYMGRMGFTTHSAVHLHVIPTNAVDETDPIVTCAEALNTPPTCPFPNQQGMAPVQPGVVGWPAGLLVLKNQPVEPNGSGLNCTGNSPAADCAPRFQYGKKDSYHYALFAHSLGLPSWTLLGGSLTSVTQIGRTVTFTTSSPHLLSGTNDPNCPNGRVTVAFAITNPNMNGTFCVQTPTGSTFSIQVANSTNVNYTVTTDPNLAVASGQHGTISGFSDIGGADSLIALGSWGSFGVPWNAKAGTFMHELGHSNGLTHGGVFFDNLLGNPNDFTPTIESNCKPNVQTVMNYLFQVDLLDVGGVSNVPDYSEQALAMLNESSGETPTFLSGATYQSTFWYDITSHGGSNSASYHCDGAPKSNTDPDTKMYLTPAPTYPLKWTAAQDVNYDGKIEASLRGHDEWNGTPSVPGLDLRQIGATGSLTVAGGKGFQGGSGGKGLQGGAGGIGLQGGGGGKGLQGGAGGKGLQGGAGGVSELNVQTATSVTRPPRNLTATEGVSPRAINLSFISPTSGVIGHYNVYRAVTGSAFSNVASVPGVSGAQPGTAYMFQDSPPCNPLGYQYYVTAVMFVGTPPTTPQESVGSNTVPVSGQPAMTACYTNTPPTVTLNNLSFPNTSFVQGTSVPITWSLQDDDTSVFVNKTTANTTLVAIGPIQPTSVGGPCPAFPANPPPPISLLTNGVANEGASTFNVSAGPNYQFTYNLDTDQLLSGCYFFRLNVDSGQSETTVAALQLGIDVNDTDSTPHIGTVALPSGTVGLAYSNALTEDGGTAPFTWSSAGSLPPLISLGINGVVSGTTCMAGNYNFTAQVSDSKRNSGSQPLTLLINKATTTTVVMSSANPSVFQQMVTFTVTVSPQYTCTPTGTVTLLDGGNPIASNLPLNINGTATFTTSALSVAMHNITASYSGDGNFTSSNSGNLVQTVNQAMTTINSVLPSPAVVGQVINVAYTLAVVAPGAGTPIRPSGTITALSSDGSSCMVAAALGAVACQLSPAPATAGMFTLAVTYSGDGNFVMSGANTNYTVNIYVSDTAPPPYTTTATTLPNAVVGSTYANTVYESGGVTTGPNNFSWAIVPGSVMPGGGSTLPSVAFQANAAGATNGTLSGTPTSAGTFTFTAMVTDSAAAGNTGTQNLAITVLAPAPAPYGLVSWYPFEGNANDLEKNNSGSVVGTPQFVSAEVDNGLKPGPQLSGSLVTVPDSPTLALTQFTIGAWVRVDGIDADQTMQIVWKGDSTAGDLTTPYSLSVLGSVGGSFSPGATVVGTPGPGQVLVILTDGKHELDVVSTHALPRDGKFHYIAVTADGTNVNLYIDGALDPNTPASESSLSPLPFAPANPLQIGGILGGPAPGNNFDGVIDELQIWNRPLTAAEVSGIFTTVGEYQPVAPPAGLVSWWPAEGNYTDIINGNSGTPSGSVGFAPGEVGQALSFNNATNNAEITVPDNANLGVGQITIEAWVKPTTSGHGRPIVQKRSALNVGGYTFETTDTSDGPGPANGLEFAIWISGTQYLLQTPANALTIGAWQHVAATFDGSTMNIYVNGVLQASRAATGSIDIDNVDPLVMGLNVTNANWDWNGLMDEVSLYNRALTSAEIQSLVNAGGAGKAKP